MADDKTPSIEADGLEGEMCSCGATRNTQPLSAYVYALNEYATPMINAAKAGQTITFEFGEWKRTRNHETWQWVDHNYDLYIAGSVNSFQSPRYVLYHELGHILDFELATQRGQWYYSDNWAGWTEMIPYSKTQVYNCNEAFAEAFAGYFEQPEKLKRIAPNAYAYIENFIVNMK